MIPANRSDGLWNRWNIAPRETARGDAAPGPLDHRRIEETLRMIPRGARTILDAACGRGWLTNALANQHKVVALDYVFDVLREVRSPAVCGTVTQLPFADRAFDVTLCCEAIEHLDDAQLPVALGELARVTRQHILITVPNNEDLTLNYQRCPQCKTQFSPHGHVRSFTAETLRDLFLNIGAARVECRVVKEIVPVAVFRQNRWLQSLRPERMGFWTSADRTRCPCCGFAGYNRRLAALFRAWSLAMKLANGALHPIRTRRSCWLLGLYDAT